MIEQQLRKSLQEIYHALHLPLLKFMLSPYLSLPQLWLKYQTIIRTPTYFVDLILINLEIITFTGSAYRSPSLLTSVCIRFRSQTIVVSAHSCNRRISFSMFKWTQNTGPWIIDWLLNGTITYWLIFIYIYISLHSLSLKSFYVNSISKSTTATNFLNTTIFR